MAAPSASNPNYLTLSKTVLDAFQPSKVYGKDIFKKDECTMTCMSFDDRGEYLVTAGNDHKIRLWSCKTGVMKAEQNSMKYGVDLTRFTHKNDTIIYSSTMVDNTIRYYSLTEKKYLQYFRGHESNVTSLEMSPLNETFLSASTNEAVRLWDLRTPICQGLFPLQGHPLIAFDPEGIVFAISVNENSCIMLYDVRNFTNVSLQNRLCLGIVQVWLP
jgi:COMPASS component SWD2